MPKIPRLLIVLTVVAFLFSVIWPKVRILVHIQMSAMQAFMTFGIAALVLFLIVDHLINSSHT